MTKTHYVDCADFAADAKTLMYDPNGSAMTYDELRTLINTLQDDVQTLKDVLKNIADTRDPFEGPSLDYMQGYRDGQQHLQEMAKLGLSAVL